MNAALPRILLVEDDPTSSAFLATAVEALPAVVDVAASLAEARLLARRAHHDLLLVDAHLPDGSGIDLLRELRASRAVVALAHTAATTRAQLDPLLDAGFAEVLVKPVSTAQLQHAVRRALDRASPGRAFRAPGCGKLPVWDEDGALSAVNGHQAHARQLRALFLSGLPAQCDEVEAAFATSDADALRGGLHRLQGSCGFVAALRLGAAVRALHDAPSPAALRDFIEAIADTLAAPGN